MSTPEFSRNRFTAVALAAGGALLVASTTATSEEMFRLPASAVMQNDDNGVEGTQGFAKGFGYEVIQGFAIAEGDMVLGRVDRYGRVVEPFQTRGHGLRNAFDRWPDGVVPYTLHPGLGEIQQRNIEEAIERLNTKTRILMVETGSPEAEGYEDHLLFESSEGCASYVGRQLAEAAQAVWVAESCSVGSIVHEISHAIGLFHEHTRPDRDNHVIVDWDHVVKNKTLNFEIVGESDGAESWGPYDYGSIMHYGEYFFSRTGERTIIAPDNTDVGQRVELSATDIESIDRMYATDVTLEATIFDSDRGLEIDVSVANTGDLGARGLTLRVVGKPGTNWLSVSTENDWECLAYEDELRCERNRLIEQGSSRFTLVVDPATTGVEDIGLRVDSVTLDKDPMNNTAGTRVLDDERQAEGEGEGRKVGATPKTSAPQAAAPDAVAPPDETSVPDIAAAFSVEAPSAATPKPGADVFANANAGDDGSGGGGAGGGGGGGAGGMASLAFLALLGASRRRGTPGRRDRAPGGSSTRRERDRFRSDSR